jgi:hypothetical protein
MAAANAAVGIAVGGVLTVSDETCVDATEFCEGP